MMLQFMWPLKSTLVWTLSVDHSKPRKQTKFNPGGAWTLPSVNLKNAGQKTPPGIEAIASRCSA